MSARKNILNRLRVSPKRTEDGHLLKRQGLGPITRLPHIPEGYAGFRKIFEEKIVLSGASIEILETKQGLAAAADNFMGLNKISGLLRVSGQEVAELDWSGMNVSSGCCQQTDVIGMVKAQFGIAETGTLLCHSYKTPSISTLFLPEYCLIVIEAVHILNTMEQAWYEMRKLFQGGLPRSVNLVTGPSRTGDIEQTILIGAHGPKKLHVFIVEEWI